METSIEEQIAQRLAQLPADVRQAVLSADWEQKIQTIGEKHRLHIDQAGALGDLTLMTMLGMSRLDEYAARIAQELKVPETDAQTIAQEVNDEVFMPIRESMKGFTTPRVDARTSPQPAVPTPTAPTNATPPATPDLSKADTMLSTTIVSTSVQTKPAANPSNTPAMPPTAAPSENEPPKPSAYASDPYREPPV